MLFISLSICCRNLFFAFFFYRLIIVDMQGRNNVGSTVVARKNCRRKKKLSSICNLYKVRLFLPIFTSLPSYVFRPPQTLHKFLITCTIYKVSSTFITSCIFERKHSLDEKKTSVQILYQELWKSRRQTINPWSVNDHHVLVSFNEAWTTADRLEC